MCRIEITVELIWELKKKKTLKKNHLTIFLLIQSFYFFFDYSSVFDRKLIFLYLTNVQSTYPQNNLRIQ